MNDIIEKDTITPELNRIAQDERFKPARIAVAACQKGRQMTEFYEATLVERGIYSVSISVHDDFTVDAYRIAKNGRVIYEVPPPAPQAVQNGDTIRLKFKLHD